MKCLRAATLIRRTSVCCGSLPRPFLPTSRPVAYRLAPSHASGEALVIRPFSHTETRRKKKDRSSSDQKKSANNGTGDSMDTAEAEQRAFDFSDVQKAFDVLERRFGEELKQLRKGRRSFDSFADAIGAIPVRPDRDSKRVFPLRELATVAPLGGRRWSILAFEEASVKPIMSAVQQSADFNQQPQRSADNPFELIMTTEPERADDRARAAKDVCQAWRTGVREEARRRAELHKKWRQQRLITDDDVHMLKEKLQKLQDKRMKVIADTEKDVVQSIMAMAS